MRVIRVMVAGTVGAGKTTFVRTINSMGMIQTDRIATDATALRKPTTTVAFDFCQVNFSPQITFQIYGAPGQYRFNFMWDWLIQTADICLLLIAAHRPEDMEKTQQIISFIETRITVPMLLGLTHTDRASALASEAILAPLNQKYLNQKYKIPPTTLIVNPQVKTSVWMALETMASMLDQQAVG